MTLLGKDVSVPEVVTWGAVLVACHAAYAREVLLQVDAQTRLYALMPPAVRRALPDHPSSPRTVPFASMQFLRAFLRYIVTDTPEDPAEIAALKAALRASSRRERWFALLAAAALVACVAVVAAR